MKIAKIVAIGVVAVLLELIKPPSRPEDAPLDATLMGRLGGYLGAIMAATVIVIVLSWIAEGVFWLVKRWRIRRGYPKQS